MPLLDINGRTDTKKRLQAAFGVLNWCPGCKKSFDGRGYLAASCGVKFHKYCSEACFVKSERRGE